MGDFIDQALTALAKEAHELNTGYFPSRFGRMIELLDDFCEKKRGRAVLVQDEKARDWIRQHKIPILIRLRAIVLGQASVDSITSIRDIRSARKGRRFATHVEGSPRAQGQLAA